MQLKSQQSLLLPYLPYLFSYFFCTLFSLPCISISCLQELKISTTRAKTMIWKVKRRCWWQASEVLAVLHSVPHNVAQHWKQVRKQKNSENGNNCVMLKNVAKNELAASRWCAPLQVDLVCAAKIKKKKNRKKK